VGVANFDLYHLWHGRLIDRGYPQRHHPMRQFDFDPDVDVEVDASSLWKWKSDKPELHKFVREYFASRKEDGASPASPSCAAIKSDDLSSFGNARFTG